MEALLTLLVLFGFPLVMLYLLSSRMRRERRAMGAVQSQLAPGQQIMTAGGMYAEVVGIEGDVVVLETAPGQRSRWDRRAVARVVGPVPEAGPPGGDLQQDIQDEPPSSSTSAAGA